MLSTVPRARPRALLLVLVLLPLGCKKSGSGTFVHLEFDGTVSRENALYAIELDLQLGEQQSSTSFTAGANGSIGLPTDGALEIGSGSGELRVTARAVAKDGRLLGEGSNTGMVEAGQTVTIAITFSLPRGDGGADAWKPADEVGAPDLPASGKPPVGGSLGGTAETGIGAGGTIASDGGAPGAGGNAVGATGTGGTMGGAVGGGIAGAVGMGGIGGTGQTGTGKPGDIVQLTIQFTGEGKGTVNGINPACNSPGPCSVPIARNDPANPPKVVLSAQPDGASQFGGWLGDCGGTGNCSLTMNAPKTVTASFYVGNTMQISLNVIGLSGQSGTIVSDDGSVRCSGSCPAISVPMSANLTFLAKPDAGSSFVAWSGGCRGTAPKCPLTAVDGMNVTATFGPQAYMFVSSSQIVPGKLGDPAAADRECQRLATAIPLPGTYSAWLSTKEMGARLRVGKGGWLRTDGRPFASNIDALASRQTIYYPPRLDETGNDLGNAHNLVVTGGAADGTIADSQCAGFTSTMGDVTVGDTASGSFLWAKMQTDLDGCGRPYRLYCFRSDLAGGDVAPPPQSGRRMFVSAQPYVPAGGVAGADNLCQVEAKNANLSGQFVAFLSTSTMQAMKRITPNGPPWKRTDEVSLVRQAQDFVNGRLLATPNLTADGKTYVDFKVWTGSKTPDGVGTDNCRDWTASADSLRAIVGVSNTTATADWFATSGGNASVPCSDGNTHLLCIEP